MSLTARERRTLGRTASEIMATAPELAALFSMFNRVESGAEMPYRAQPAPSRAEPPCIMAMAPRSTPAVSLPVQSQRRMLLIIVSSLISAGLIAVAVVIGLVDHATTGVSQNPSWRVGTQQG